ncbi:MAG: ATP-binding protein [Candidatus Woesearchaeota archaeon]|jgi:PAS domain S-box-containing protein
MNKYANLSREDLIAIIKKSELDIKLGERFKVLYETSLDAISVTRASDGKFISVNPAFLNLTGFTLEEIIGKKSIDVGVWNDLNDRKEVLDTLASGNSLFNKEYFFNIKGGQVMNGLMSASIVLIDGKQHIVSTIRDITAYKLMEKKLNEKRDLMASIFNSIPNMFFVINKEGIIDDYLSSNESQLIIPPSEFIGKKIDQILPLDISKKVYENINALSISQDKIISFGYYLDINNTRKHYTCALSPLNKDDKFVANINEDTDREQNIQDLASAIKTKDKFLQIIAHDLRSPFNAILGFAELLVTEYSTLSEEDRMSSLKSIFNSSNNAYSLLESLLEWANSSTIVEKYSPENIDLRKIVSEAYALNSPNIDRNGLRFHNVVSPNTMLNADYKMVHTIVRNLIANSIKYTKYEGDIYVTAIDKGENYELTVKDSGIGMKQEVLDNIFDPYSGVSLKGVRGETGTGLGLDLVKKFTEINGGTIRVESEVDKGTTFYVSLPKAK